MSKLLKLILSLVALIAVILFMQYRQDSGYKVDNSGEVLEKFTTHENRDIEKQPIDTQQGKNNPCPRTAEEFEAKKLAESDTINKVEWNTPLTQAAEENNILMVEALLKFGADVNCKSEDFYTPLHRAAELGNVEVVKLLLATEGIDVNAKGEYGPTPLHRASYFGHVEVVRLLLAAEDIDVNATNDDGTTALHWASSQGRIDVVTLLLAVEDIDTSAKNKKGETALDVATVKYKYKTEDKAKIAVLLRDAGAL